MKEKNLDYFKDEVAKQYFASNLNLVPKSNIWLHFRSEVGCHDLVYALESAAENYANHVKAIALQEGRNEGFTKGCELQKAVCAEHAEIELPEEYGEEYIYPVDKDSILNAPDGVNPYTK